MKLEKSNACNKLISQLEIDDRISSNPQEILEAGKLFYENLYTQKNLNREDFIENSKLFTDLENIPKLSNEIKTSLESNITQKEILDSLKLLKNGKSPGTDGFTSEFYKFFWSDIRDLLLDSISYSLQYGELSTEQKRGIITLIPKKGKNRLQLKNWRPITLLNTDYKLLTKALAVRLKSILPNIINEDQTGYVKGRFIGTNIRLVEDIIHFTESYNKPGILLNIDFEKAFDTINWNFLEKSLLAFNFGPHFIHFIKTCYHNTSSCIINNGNISQWFNISRGIRQGCPVSPYLFIIAVELLAINIRENRKIKGIIIGDTEIKISQLADDTNCFLSNKESVSEIMNVFKSFSKCAGLSVNYDKTKAKYLGSLKSCKDFFAGLDWSDSHVFTLGVNITGKQTDHYELNFKDKILNLRNLLNLWKVRQLSLKGKVVVINTLALSPIMYLASVIHVPEIVMKEVKGLVTDFLWDNKTPKITYDVLIQQIQDAWWLKTGRF